MLTQRNKIFLIVTCILAGLCGGLFLFLHMPAQQYKHSLTLGIRFLNEGNYEDAEASFLDAIDIDPKQPDAYQGMVSVYMTQADEISEEDPEQAEKYYDLALSYAEKAKEAGKWTIDLSDYGTYAPDAKEDAESEEKVVSSDTSESSSEEPTAATPTYYRLYADYVKSLESQYGKGFINDGSYEPDDWYEYWMDGVSIVRLIDMNNDGIQELFIGYSDADYNRYGEICSYDQESLIHYKGQLAPGDGDLVNWYTFYRLSDNRAVWNYASYSYSNHTWTPNYVSLENGTFSVSDLSADISNEYFNNSDHYYYNGKEISTITYLYSEVDKENLPKLQESLDETNATRELLGITEDGSISTLTASDQKSVTDYSREELAQIVVEHYEELWQPDGSYSLSELDDTSDGFSGILRLARNNAGSANTLVTKIYVNTTTGYVYDADNYADGWYVQ